MFYVNCGIQGNKYGVQNYSFNNLAIISTQGVGIAQSVYKTRLWAGQPIFYSWWGQRIFLFTTTSRPALRPTQPPIQWVLVALSPEVKWPGKEADHSPPRSVEVKNVCGSTTIHLYVSMVWCLVKYRIHLHGVVLG
jgi:hypothetical protein